MINRREALMLASAGFLVPSTSALAAQGTPTASPAASPVATTTPTRGSWKMSGGNPTRSGVMPGPIPSLEMPIVVRWQYEPEDEWLYEGEPVIANGIVYTRTGSNIHAVDVDSGLEFWRYEISDVSSLTIDAGTLYASTSDGLHAIATETGLTKWIHGKSMDDGTPTPYGNEYGSAAVQNGIIAVKGGGALHALDANTGETLWQFPVTDGLPYTVIAQELVFGADDAGLVALNLQTGNQIWRSSAVTAMFAATGTIAITAGSDFLSGFDIATGQEHWRYTIQDNVTGVGISESQIILNIVTESDTGYYNSEIQAIDTETGGLLWMYSLGESSDSSYSEMRIVRNQLFLKIADPNNLLIVIDTTTGLKTWEYRGYIADVYPVAVDRNLYFVHDSQLFCIGNLLDPALISDVTLRAAPAESGLERGTASVGDVIDKVGARSENNGEVWVEITVSGVVGWVPASAIDPATLPPEGDVWVICDPAWF